MRKLTVILLFIIALSGCEEYFVPEIETQSSSLVFEGMFTNIEGSHVVKISRSQAVNKDSFLLKATGFTVFIEDNEGSLLDTREKYPGSYHTRSFQKGEIGKKYRLLATSPEGKKYYSTWEIMEDAAPIDTVTGAFAQNEILLANENGSYIEQTQRGMNILCNSKTQGYSPYNRYEYNMVFQTVQIYPTQPFSTMYYIARPTYSKNYDYVSVSNGNLYDGNNIVSHVIDFVPDGLMEHQIVITDEEIDEDGEPIYEPWEISFWQAGVLVKVKQYALSENGYIFWNAVYKQKNSTGQIFDPVESQVMGNMFCSSDSTEQVFGYFGASSVTEKSVFLYLKTRNTVTIKEVVYFPDLARNLVSLSQPDFWVVY